MFHRAKIKVANDTSIRMNDSIINSVIRDSKLNWIPHIIYVQNKISKGIVYGERLFKYLNLHHIYLYISVG